MPIQYDLASPEGPRILVLDSIHPAGIERLRTMAAVDIVTGPRLTPEQIHSCISDYQAVINRGRTPIPGKVIRNGSQLRMIVRAGVGLDNIDTAVAEEMGIPVVNCPDATTMAVAEHTFALLLAAARHVAAADATLKAGKWHKSTFNGIGLAGKTLGIIGFGRIGREVARRAKAFDMHVLVNQTRPTSELAQEWSVESVGLTDLLHRADFVTLHVPGRSSTVNLLGVDELAMMRQGAILINTARGAVVDQSALLDALDRGWLASAALDVFVDEPMPLPALIQHPRVVATPHIGASTEDAQRKVSLDAAEQIIAVLQRRRIADTLALRVVPVSQVAPHEYHHPRRVEHLARRLAEDGILVNPPVVTELNKRYIVLDGATRVTAFGKLGHRHIVVQLVDVHRDNVQLYTWYHAVHGLSASALLSLVQSVQGLRITEMAVESLAHSLWERGAVGYLVMADKRGFLLELNDQVAGDWVDVLNQLVNGYGAMADVDRTVNTDIDELKIQFPDLAGLFVYPQFAPDIVLKSAARGRLLPAGLTRFVIPGRILRLNAPLEILGSTMALNEKEDWLDAVVQQKLQGKRLRYYEEPVVLLDE